MYCTWHIMPVSSAFDVVFSCQHSRFLLGRAEVIHFHMIWGFIWTFALRVACTQTDSVPSDSWMLIPDQKAKCILQIWYTDFLNLQPSKCNNALNFNMWLHLTSVSLPINSFQLWFFGGERNAWQARLKLVKLNSAWNILLHQIVLALSHFWTCPSNLESGYGICIHAWGNVDDGPCHHWNGWKLWKWQICPPMKMLSSPNHPGCISPLLCPCVGPAASQLPEERSMLTVLHTWD